MLGCLLGGMRVISYFAGVCVCVCVRRLLLWGGGCVRVRVSLGYDPYMMGCWSCTVWNGIMVVGRARLRRALHMVLHGGFVLVKR